MLFAVLALGACLLMTAHRRATRAAARPDRSARVIALGVLIGLAALTRNEAIWLRPGLAARRRPGSAPASVRLVAVAGARRARSSSLPWAIRDWVVVRQPAARPGGDQRVLRSPASTSSPGTTRRPCPATSRSVPPACSRCGSTGFGHNLFSVLLARRPADLAHRPARRCRGRRAARPSGPVVLLSRHHVPRHQPALPGRHDVGHVPARVGAGPRPASSCRRCWRSTP